MLARYTVEDNGEIWVVEDMRKMQAAPVIKSILMKLLGKVREYSEE